VSSYHLSASTPPCGGTSASRSETSRCDEWHGQRMIGIRRVIGLAVRTMFLIIPSPQKSSYQFDDYVTGQQQGSYAQAVQGNKASLSRG
jgi:hypothetical protein